MKSIIYKTHGRNVELPMEYEHLIQMKRREDLANEFGISKRILLRRLESKGIKLSKYHILPIEDVIEIYLVLGWPIKHRQQIAHTNSLTPTPSSGLFGQKR